MSYSTMKNILKLKTSLKDHPEDIIKKIAPPYDTYQAFYDINNGWKIATNYLLITCYEKTGEVWIEYPEK